MSATTLDRLIDCQAALLAALDARDVTLLERATADLAAAVEAARATDVWHDQAPTRAKIEYGLKQTEAGRIRVNVLTDWTRQKLETLADLRGLPPTGGYAKPAIQRFQRLPA